MVAVNSAERAGIVLGVLGFLLSLHNAWRQWWNDRPHMRVGLQRFVPSNTRRGLLEVRIANGGRHTVAVRRVGFFVGGQPLRLDAWEHRMIGPGDHPFDVEPGRAINLHLPEEPIVQALRRDGRSGSVDVRACCWDQLDNLYRSKPLRTEV